MSPNDKTKSGKRKNLFKDGFAFSRRIHWPQVKRAVDRIQEIFPKELSVALFHSVTTEGIEVWKEFYREDVLEVGKAAKSGKLSLKSLFSGQMGAVNPMQFRPSKLKAMASDAKSPLLNFLNQLSSDLSEQKNSQDKATYILKVGTLFASSAFSLTAALRVATFGLAKNKLGRYPWIPSIGLVLGASILARLLDHASVHMEDDSKDRELAQFLKANFEILAFGGSLGILEIPDFVANPGDDPALRALQQLISELMGPVAIPKLIGES